MAISSASSAFSSASAALYAANGLSAIYGGQNDRVSSALRQSNESSSREIESARVQLSSFGRVQSAAASVQSAARRLQATDEQTSAAAVRQAAETFVQAFNDQRAALTQASGAVGGNARPAGIASSTGNDARAVVASSQLQRLSAEVSPALREAGIRVERDGSLSVDAKALESAFNANPKAVTQALGEVGRAAEVTVTRQLAQTGSVGGAVRNLETRVEQLETRQATVQNGFDAAQRAVEAASRRYGFGAVGAGAYLGIFGL